MRCYHTPITTHSHYTITVPSRTRYSKKRSRRWTMMFRHGRKLRFHKHSTLYYTLINILYILLRIYLYSHTHTLTHAHTLMHIHTYIYINTHNNVGVWHLLITKTTVYVVAVLVVYRGTWKKEEERGGGGGGRITM